MLDTRKVSKNAILLGGRTLFTVFLSFYVSRLLLLNLGETNFGIYSIVGSVIVLWGSLRGLFASSTQRFLNVASVNEDKSYSYKIFSNSLFIHIVIALIFLLLVGGIGTYLINNVLTIPNEAITQANVIFLASLLSSVISVLTTPFDAAIIAHERMGFFALTSIIDVVGRLIIALCIPYTSIDKLIFWGCTYAVLVLFIRMAVVLYAKKHCPEVNFNPLRDSFILRELAKFAGWNFLGNTSFYIVSEGLNFILNMFWGVALNAARGIALQVQSGVSTFTGNIMTASDPQICKLYAEGNFKSMMRLFSQSSRSLTYIYIAVALPIIISASPILNLWLKEVPPYTEEMVILMLTYGFLRTFHSPLNSLFFATAKLKKYQITELIIRTSTVILAFFFAKMSALPPHYVYVILCCTELINTFIIIFVARIEFNFDIQAYLNIVLVPIGKVVVVLFIIYNCASCVPLVNTMHWIATSSLAFIIICLVSFMIGLTSSERATVKSMITNKIKAL
ncbi:lipopolysaccharide biosynthesis protein [Porphyromonas somerae]|uniref:lipopolysaccharide biosynthesis protein n=1 Tax=Porphyromonas somerae TaxID=322095 RepID=UPI000371C3DE|nr:hypothetical protein [Porphyromonas somerae]